MRSKGSITREIWHHKFLTRMNIPWICHRTVALAAVFAKSERDKFVTNTLTLKLAPIRCGIMRGRQNCARLCECCSTAAYSTRGLRQNMLADGIYKSQVLCCLLLINTENTMQKNDMWNWHWLPLTAQPLIFLYILQLLVVTLTRHSAQQNARQILSKPI